MANKPTKPNFPLGLESQEQSVFQEGILNNGVVEHGPDAVMTVPETPDASGVPSAVRYNEDDDQFEGYYNEGGWLPLGGGNGGRWEALPHASSSLLQAGRAYLVDNTDGASTVLFPSPKRIGDSVTVCDLYGKFSTYPLTVDGNGKSIYGSADSMTISTDNVSATFTWTGEARGWVITSGVGLGQGRVYSREIYSQVLSAETSSITLSTQPTIVDVYADGKRLKESLYTLDGYEVKFDPALASGSDVQIIQYIPIQLGVGGGGSGGTVITWEYNGGAAVGGETQIVLDVVVDSVSEIYIRGQRQQIGRGFTFDAETSTITLADELETGDDVVVIINGDPTVYNQIDRTPWEVARANNVSNDEVILSTDKQTVLDGKTVLYDVATQTSWGIPSGIPSGVKISNVSEGTLVYTPGGVIVHLHKYSGIQIFNPDGLKYIGSCHSISELRNVEPSTPGQQIYLESLQDGWAATASGMPWGGGKLRYITSLPTALQIDDGGSIFKTIGGKCWVREELLTGLGEIRVEWYLSGGPSLLEDGTASLQAAADTARLWAQYSDRNKTVRLVFPSLLRITGTVNIYTRGVRVDGNHGMLLITSDMSYTKYTDLSTNTHITTSPDTHADVTVGINLTHGAGGTPSPGFPNPAYSGQEFIKDLNIAYGVATGVSTYQLSAMADNGVAAICHWGTSTVAAAQGFMTNVSFQNFGVGYINGNNVWGVDFHECKWSGCWIPMWLINGADNAERYTLFGCVMQNGYRCVYSPWGGDFNIVKGSYVWNTGPYFHFPTASNMIDINPSRIEMVNTSQPLLIVDTSIETGATAQTYPLVKLHGAMLLLDASTVQPANYLFSVSKYSKLVVEDNTWSNKNMTNLANLKLLNPSDTGGKVLFRNNTMRVGIFSEFARDNRLLTSTTPAGRLDGITLAGVNAANATVSVSGANLTLTVNATASGALTLLLRIPIDSDMSDWDSFSWKAVFNNMSLNGTWSLNAFVNVSGSNYVNNRLDLGSVSLNSVVDISDVCSNNSYGFKRIQKRADGGWERIPTELYLYFSSTAQQAGDTFTINRAGLLGY